MGQIVDLFYQESLNFPGYTDDMIITNIVASATVWYCKTNVIQNLILESTEILEINASTELWHKNNMKC